MGILEDGQWHEQAHGLRADDGRFHRPESRFRNWVTRDGAPGPSGTGGYRRRAGVITSTSRSPAPGRTGR